MSIIEITGYGIVLLAIVTILTYMYAVYRNNIKRYLNLGQKKKGGYLSVDQSVEYGSMSR